MYRMQIGKCFLDAHQIRFIKSTANTDVPGEERYSVRNGSKPADENKIDFRRNQSAH
jgi:hypothetical protein